MQNLCVYISVFVWICAYEYKIHGGHNLWSWSYTDMDAGNWIWFLCNSSVNSLSVLLSLQVQGYRS